MTCAYCGIDVYGGIESMTAHMLVCPSNPMTNVVTALKSLVLAADQIESMPPRESLDRLERFVHEADLALLRVDPSWDLRALSRPESGPVTT